MKTVLIAVIMLGGVALGQGSNLRTDGTALRHACNDQKPTNIDAGTKIAWGMGYCFGVINTVVEILQTKGDIQMPEGDISFEQVQKIVMNYLEAHPEKWQKPVSVLVTEALKQAWGTTTKGN